MKIAQCPIGHRARAEGDALFAQSGASRRWQPHGRRYVVEGLLIAPDGTGLNVRSAWYINLAGGAPRFVTAHPLPKL